VARVGILLIAVALIAVTVGCTPASQDLEIRTWYDLAAIADNMAGNHRLMNDLDSSTSGYLELASPTANGRQGWQPIGQSSGEGGFTGTFDGQGYEIRDLFMNYHDSGYAGLFGMVARQGRIENLGVVNATITGPAYVGAVAGVLAARYDEGWSEGGSLDNCYSSGSITGGTSSIMVGGLVGYGYGTISNSYSTASVTGCTGIGGLVGYSDGIVNACYSTGSVAGTDLFVGGLAGWNRGTVSDSYSTGSVTGGHSVGGLLGFNGMTGDSVAIVTDCYSTGNVTGNPAVGGLIGATSDWGTATNSFWDVETSGQVTSAGGTGLNTTEMQSIATFSGAAWNIVSVGLNETNPAYIWNIVNNATYPFLNW
jgi:hypothetical protein